MFFLKPKKTTIILHTETASTWEGSQRDRRLLVLEIYTYKITGHKHKET